MFKSIFYPTRGKPAVEQISPAKVESMLAGNEPAVVLDVRTPEEYAFDGHIAGSRLMPLSAVSIRGHELPQDLPIICVCRSGARSQAACEILQQQGFTNVQNMSGGMIAWKQSGLTTAH